MHCSYGQMVTLFLEYVYTQPTWIYEPEIVEKVVDFTKTINLRHVSQNPLLNNDGIVRPEKKVGVGCCIYQFSLPSFFFHPPFVCHSMAKDRFRPSRLSGKHGIA